MNATGDDDDAYFVEYVNEDDDHMTTTENNEPEYEVNQFEYAEDDDEDSDSEELYNCNLCGMNFKSIHEHVEKYHSGQDVVIDVSEDSDSVVKIEKSDDPLEYVENENEELITSDNIEIKDGELIVYGEDGLENENEILEEITFDGDDSEVYTYDDTTGCLTRTSIKNPKQFKTITNVVKPTIKETTTTTTPTTTNKSPKRFIKPTNRTKSKFPRGDDERTSDHVCDICNTIFYSAKSLK